MLKIEKQKTAKDDYAGVEFVLKATTKDQTRLNLNNVFFDGACFWGTDGQRMHYYYMNNTDIALGAYEVISKDKKTIVLDKSDLTYPDIFMLIKDLIYKKDREEIEIGLDKNIQNTSIAYSKIIKRLPDNNGREETLNFKFLEDLLPDNYTACITGYGDPVWLGNHNKGAALMPLRIK
jgi:hypothetical protein